MGEKKSSENGLETTRTFYLFRFEKKKLFLQRSDSFPSEKYDLSTTRRNIRKIKVFDELRRNELTRNELTRNELVFARNNKLFLDRSGSFHHELHYHKPQIHHSHDQPVQAQQAANPPQPRPSHASTADRKSTTTNRKLTANPPHHDDRKPNT